VQKLEPLRSKGFAPASLMIVSFKYFSQVVEAEELTIRGPLAQGPPAELDQSVWLED